MAAPLDVVALLSLEPWDDVWRRNQHLAAALVDDGHATEVIFVEPPVRGRVGRTRTVRAGVEVVTPPLPAPRRLGGLTATAAWLRVTALGRASHLWVNDATLGALCLRAGQPTVYDVTDDWRDADQPAHVRERLVAAEARLATQATTVVCSKVLQQRWRERYGVAALLVPNAVDEAAWKDVRQRPLSGPGPHVGYVGTLHDERLDVGLVVELATAAVATVHLVGPDHLQTQSRDRLIAAGAVLAGPVPAVDVPGWMTSMDVLLCPHVVTDFTRSLDAIKAYEYAASGRPVVATPTSGFQEGTRADLYLRGRGDFVATVAELVASGRPLGEPGGQETWSERAVAFADAFRGGPRPASGRLPASPSAPVRLRRRALRDARLTVANMRSPRARFGAGSEIGPGLRLSLEGTGRIWFGRECIVDEGAVLHAAGELVVGDRTILGHHVTLAAKESLRIGRNCLLGEMVSVRDHDHRFAATDVPMRDQGSKSAPVVIGDDVWLGSKVVVTSGVRIGRGTVVGANSVVTRDLPSGVIAAGVPAVVIRSRS